MPATSPRKAIQVDSGDGAVIDLDRYVPAFLTWTANKLSSGASQVYLDQFGVGMETWRCLALLAAKPAISAQQVCKLMGMDKGSVSRCFKSMLREKLIVLTLSATDGRLRLASLTTKGRKVHGQIIGVALERERALLSPLSATERETFRNLLQRVHEGLPAVERVTQAYMEKNFPRAARTVVASPGISARSNARGTPATKSRS